MNFEIENKAENSCALIQRRNQYETRKKEKHGPWIQFVQTLKASIILKLMSPLMPNSGQVAASNSRNHLQHKVPSTHGLPKPLLLARNQGPIFVKLNYPWASGIS